MLTCAADSSVFNVDTVSSVGVIQALCQCELTTRAGHIVQVDGPITSRVRHQCLSTCHNNVTIMWAIVDIIMATKSRV